MNKNEREYSRHELREVGHRYAAELREHTNLVARHLRQAQRQLNGRNLEMVEAHLERVKIGREVMRFLVAELRQIEKEIDC